MMGWRFLLKGLRWQLMLAMTTVAMTVAAQRITTPSQTIDCGQVLFRNPVTAHFELTNEGSGNVTIKSVDTSCGCTGVSYPVGIISENKPFVVSATYDAKQMGHFEKYIDIYTNGASLPFTLTMRGVVVGEIKDFGGQYPFTLGKIKADADRLFFDDVTKGETPSMDIHVMNNTGDVMTPVLRDMPKYLKAEISPSSIAPGRSGVVHFTLDADKIGHTGLEQARVFLNATAAEKNSDDKAIKVEAILVPSFGEVSERQLAYMPKLRLSEETIELGSFEGKKKKKGSVILENRGRTDLEIYSIQSFTEGVTLELGETVIHPGESAKLKVVAERKILKGVVEQPRVLLITNDPKASKVIIDINVK